MILPYDCSMQLTHITTTTRIVLSKSDVEHLHNSHAQHEECLSILKHFFKPYESHSHSQNVRMTSCVQSLLDASSMCYKSRIQQL